MATNQTEHYKLNQWELSDSVVMEEFNADNQKVDAVLKRIDTTLTQLAAAMPHVQAGTYEGTGTYGAEHPNTLTFDFHPKLVIINDYTIDEDSDGKDWIRFIAVYGTPVCCSDKSPGANATQGIMHLTWGANTLSWYIASGNASTQGNTAGRTYHYIAIG